MYPERLSGAEPPSPLLFSKWNENVCVIFFLSVGTFSRKIRF